MSRVAASTALRSVILAATACSGAASAATSAADELAELRKDFRRSVEQREARRSSSAPFVGTRNYLKERDPDSFARVEEQSQAAQERAEAALRGHRQTRLALHRQQALKKDAEGTEAMDMVERSRRETASAITKTAEVRTELAAAQLELTEEQQARRKLAEEAEALSARIRHTQAEAALARTELDGIRASEAASLSKIREELHTSRSQTLAEAAAAIRAQEASRDASEAAAASAAMAAKAKEAFDHEAATASSLRRSLQEAMAQAAAVKDECCSQQVAASTRVLQLEHAEAQALTALSRDSMQHELSEMLVARREKATRRLVSSLLASSFEGFLRMALRAWRKVKDHESLSKEAEEAVLQRREVAELRAELAAVPSCPDCGNVYVADAKFCRHCGTRREDEDALAAARAEADALRKEVESLTSDARAATDKAAEAQVELERARSKEATLLEGLRNAQSQEASSSELLNRQLADTRSSEAASFQRFRSELHQARTEALQSRSDVQEAALAAKEATEEAAHSRTREVNAISSMQQRLSYTAEEVATARAEVAVRQVRLEQLEELQERSESAAASFDTCRDRAVEAALTRREEVSRRVIASLLASHTEALLQRAMVEWRKAAQAQAQAERQSQVDDALRAELEELRGQLKAATAAAVSAEALRAKEQLVAEQQAKEHASLRSQLQFVQDELAAAKAAAVAAETLRAEDRLAAEKESQESTALRAELNSLRQQLAAAKAVATKAEQELKSKADLAAESSHEAASLRTELEELRAELRHSTNKREAAVVASDLKAKDQLWLICHEALSSQAAVMALTQREEASRRMFASLLSSRLEGLLRNALRAWRATSEKAAEVTAAIAEASELRLSVSVLEQDLASVKAELRASAAEAARRSAAVLALTRREEAVRHQMSSLLAAQMVSLMCNAFRGWRSVQAMQEHSRAEQLEVLTLRSDLSELRERLTEKAATDAAAAAGPAQALTPADAATHVEMLCLRQTAEASRRVIASLLSSRLEADLRLAFSAWHSAQVMERESAQMTREAEQLRLLLRSAETNLNASQELAAARADEVSCWGAGAPDADLESSRRALEQMAILRFFERREAALSKAFASLLSQREQDFLATILREWRHCINCGSPGGSSSPALTRRANMALTLDLQSDRYVNSRQTSKSSAGAAAAAWDRFHELDMDDGPEL